MKKITYVLPVREFIELVRTIFVDPTLVLCAEDIPHITLVTSSGNYHQNRYSYDNVLKALTEHFGETISHFYYDDIGETVVLSTDTEAKREFFVDTPLGKLHVYAKHETDSPEDFPGVFVDLITPAYPEGDCLVCTEYESCNKLIQTCVYQPNEDEPVEVIIHDEPNLARIAYDENGKLHYYDKFGAEIFSGMVIAFDDGREETVYQTDDGRLGIDATNKALIEKGRACPCEYGIYPFTVDDLQEIEVLP